MIRLTTLRAPVLGAALAACAATMLGLATPAMARPHHARHAHVPAARHHAFLHRHHGRHVRHAAYRAPMTMAQGAYGAAGFGASNVVEEARRYIGGNPTGRGSLWCARFMNMVLERSGHRGSGSDMARSFASYGQRIAGPQVGAIAVMSRGRGGGHVGVVSGVDPNGNPIVISGNHGHRVAEAVYPRGRIYAYVMPTS